MANDSFRRAVDGRLSNVTMSPALQGRVRRRAAAETALPARAKPPVTFRRVLAAGLAAVMTFAFGITVMAAVMPPFERLLMSLGDVRNLLQPIELVSENGGVRMEVVAAINDGENAYVYLTMQDLENRGLITENTGLMDVDFGDGEYMRAEQIAFDAENGIATYRLQWNDAFSDISGQRITLHVEGLLLDREWLHDFDTGYTLADIMALNPEPASTYPSSYDRHTIQFGQSDTLANEIDEMYRAGTMPLLERGGLAEPIVTVPWMPITSAGVVDGLLHIQSENESFVSRFDRTDLYLAYPGDDEQWLTAAKSSHNPVDTSGSYEHYEFHEWVLEIPADVDPAKVRIMAGGVVTGGYHDASWEVTFTFDEDVEVLEWQCSIDMGGWKIKRLELSPIGITAFGRGTMGEDDGWLEMQAVLYDGTVVESDSSSVSVRFNGEIVSQIGFKGLVDPTDVEKILINGQEFPVATAQLYNSGQNAA